MTLLDTASADEIGISVISVGCVKVQRENGIISGVFPQISQYVEQLLDLKEYKFEVLIHTYIHTHIIDHYNPSVRIIDLVPHITYVVCVNLIHKWQDLQFKVDSERQIF